MRDAVRKLTELVPASFGCFTGTFLLQVIDPESLSIRKPTFRAFLGSLRAC